jgi:hypothetical protein
VAYLPPHLFDLAAGHGTDVKVQQERHADIQTTLNVYTQAVSDAKRDANRTVVEMVLKPAGAGKQKGPPQAALSGS